MAMKYIVEPPDHHKAACAGLDTDLFYPEGKEGYDNLDVLKRVCAECPIKAECLEWALHYERHGFWGGTSEHDRLPIRRRRGITSINLLVEAMGNGGVVRSA